MSWNINICGKIKNIRNAVENYDANKTAFSISSSCSSGLSENQKEYDLAKPYILGIINLNKNEDSAIIVRGDGGTYKTADYSTGKIQNEDWCSIEIKQLRGLVD
jgi:hypothetical protein